METIYLSLRAQVAGGTFFMKSPVVKGTVTNKFFFGRATMNFNTAKQIATILNNKNGQLVLNDEWGWTVF